MNIWTGEPPRGMRSAGPPRGGIALLVQATRPGIFPPALAAEIIAGPDTIIFLAEVDGAPAGYAYGEVIALLDAVAPQDASAGYRS
jgi:hypothetical protein